MESNKTGQILMTQRTFQRNLTIDIGPWLTDEITGNQQQSESNKNVRYPSNISLFLCPATKHEVEKVIKLLKAIVGTGYDNVSAKALKTCTHYFKRPLYQIIIYA